MQNKLRKDLINQLSELSLSLSDSLERVGESELESNRSTGAGQPEASSERSSLFDDDTAADKPADVI